MVSLKGVTVAFGAEKVLDELTLELEEPGAYLILGANGSGKTVLLDVIGGRRRPDQGKVLLGSVPVYGLFGPDLPRIEYLQREAVPEEPDTLWNLFIYQARQDGGWVKPRELMLRFHLPWSEDEMRRLRLDMLPQSEVLEFELLCAFAVRPDYLLVDDYLSRFSFDTCERAIANLRAWQKMGTSTAILTSSRFFGHMDGFAGVYHLSGGKLVELSRADGAGASDSAEPREVLVVCGEYFYRHSRAQEENEHLAVKAVLENALLIEIKSTLDKALAHLQSMGIDLVAVVLAPDAESYEYSHQKFF